MCGITGIYGYKTRSSAESQVRAMNQAIAHRGPDDEGIWSSDHCVLGHRRLSIIDTSSAGHQPFFSADRKIVVVFNGEIYNYLELKRELSEDYPFATASDTEVIIAAYKKWGIHCVEHFLGMFAFALYDQDKNETYLVRDRLGIKPLYIADTSEGFLFASEIRAILKTGLVSKKASLQAVSDYLRYQTVHAPHTIIEGVGMLMPGHYMRLTSEGRTTTCYWDLTKNAGRISDGEDPARVRKNIADILRSAVEIRMRADVSFGAFLSGGIDSSVVVGLMSRISTHKVRTFSITFHEKEFDESTYSSLIAKKFNTDHTAIQVRASHFLDLVPEALAAMDHPSGDGPNTYVVSKVTRESGIKMALSGLGGDEVFAGYSIFTRIASLESKKWLTAIPSPFLSVGGKMLRRLRPSVASEKIAASLSSGKTDFEHFYPVSRMVLLDPDVRRLLRGETLPPNVVKGMVSEISKSSLPLLSKVSVAEMETYMQNVLLRDTDQMSMAHALEVRVPFLDHRLVEYVLGVSDPLKYPHSPKELLTSSVGDLLPREIIDRPKMGFTFPWAYWMKNELRTFCEENLHALSQLEVIDASAVDKIWQRFIKGDKLITWSRVWPMVVLGHWVKQHDVH